LTTDLEIAEADAVLTERKRELAEMEAGSRQEDIDEARAKMTAAKAIMSNMSKKLNRARSLSSRNVITQDQYEDALEREEASRQVYLATEATYKRFMAGPRKEQIGQAQARVDAQQNQVEFLNAEKEKRITRAPFAGFVVQEHTNLGQWLAKGDPIVTLAQMDQVDVIANVDQRDESLVRLFEKAQVRINGLEQQDWTGRIEAIVPRSNWRSGSRGFPVKVRLQNTAIAVSGAESNRRLPLLKEGMMAHVTFRGAPLKALLVPKDALVRTSRGTQIFLFTPLVRPKWSVHLKGELLGNVVAADDQSAHTMACKQFEIKDDGTALQVTQTTRPRWQVNRTPRPGENSEVIGYLQADSQDLALAEARKQFGVADSQAVVVLPQLGTVRRVVVEIGISEGEKVQLLGSQADSGAFVVTEGAERLNDYQDVQLSREKIITDEATMSGAQ
ncbi:MAG: efflux RND transporter periplasmic adaptor subunit, partial [Pirellulaceae bacterium]